LAALSQRFEVHPNQITEWNENDNSASLFVDPHCCDERDFVFGALTDLATGQFATKICIIDLDTF